METMPLRRHVPEAFLGKVQHLNGHEEATGRVEETAGSDVEKNNTCKGVELKLVFFSLPVVLIAPLLRFTANTRHDGRSHRCSGADPLLLQASAVFDPVQSDFNLDGMEGEWWLVSMASHCKEYIKDQKYYRPGLLTFTAKENGSFAVFYRSMWSNGTCYTVSTFAEKTNTPGEFTIKNGVLKESLKFISVKKNEYALIYSMKTEKETGTALEMYTLFARDKEPSQELPRQMKDFTRTKGISEKNTVILSPKQLRPECLTSS
ncbi:hypothetical protein WMY93_024843 [Mugilogobius chulae]|uniref:Lipocalin/cytosolic fatty-acid binding domain-containing protein n=1 Tax=Mugilogobius chulae TaxID=88201 RepID=A0AAW0N1R7_9GOBI